MFVALGDGGSKPGSADRGRELVLASGSPYRRRILAEAGFRLTVDVPGVDERALDDRLAELGGSALSVELAVLKAEAVASRHPGQQVLAGDQVGVVRTAGGPLQLHKQPDEDSAVEQLMQLSGTTHHLHNGMCLLDVDSGARVCDVDVQEVTMRSFSEPEARSYVRRFAPHDTAGSYRMEDGESMAPLEPFVVSVVGEDPTGVLGVPVPMLRRMILRLDSELGR